MADTLTNEDMHALLDAWERWDDSPTMRERVVAYEDALKVAAAALGITPLSLRAGLVRHKSEGLGRAAALAAIRRGLATSASQ